VGSWSVDGCVRADWLRVAVFWLCLPCDLVLSLTRVTADVLYDAVDLYNSATGSWSTAQLSVGRHGLAAASVGNVALFAGGNTGGLLLRKEGCGVMEC
jgi:hypothetical protein